MKILVLIGSYRKNGNTDRICSLIVSHLKQTAEDYNEPLELETVYLGQEQIGLCRGCRICMDRGEEKCPLKDSLLEIKAKMRAADGLLVGCPVYVDDVNGITKNWIDRLGHVNHRPEFAGRCASIVATVGSSPVNHTLGTLNMALTTWGFAITGKRGLKMGALMKVEEAQNRYEPQAQQLARDLFHAIRRRKFESPSFRSLMVFKIQQHYWQSAPRKKPGIQETIDYQYWQKQGWIDARAVYYIPQHASPVKLVLARFAGTLIAPFVS